MRVNLCANNQVVSSFVLNECEYRGKSGCEIIGGRCFDCVKVLADRVIEWYDSQAEAEHRLNRFMKRVALPAGIATAVAKVPQVAMAATADPSHIAHMLDPLISMIQGFAMPVGIVISTWGLIEIMIGNLESGKQKVKYSLLGFIGIYVVPFIFSTIQKSLNGGMM